MFEVGFQLGINIFDTLVLVQYLNAFYKRRLISTKTLILIGSITSIILTAIHFIMPINNSQRFVHILFVVFFAYLYVGKIIHKCIVSIAYIILEIIVKFIMTLALGIQLDKVTTLSDSTVLYIVLIISELFRYLFCLFIYQLKKEEIEIKSKKVKLFLLTIPILTILLMCEMITKLIEFPMQDVENKLFSLLVLLYINFLILLLFEQFGKLAMENKRSRLLLQEIQLKEDYYKRVEEEQQRIRVIRHDLKNQLLSVSCSLDTSKEEQKYEVKEMLKDIDDTTIYTHNSVVNHILDMKLTPIRQEIELNIDIQIPNKINIEHKDISIILGNLLDNAIEACQKASNATKFINIKMRAYKGSLTIDISNSMQEPVDKEFYKNTSKEDKKNHGIGLKSVEKMINKYDGLIEINIENNIFKVNILLCNQMNREK